jgi:hypothetical protein
VGAGICYIQIIMLKNLIENIMKKYTITFLSVALMLFIAGMNSSVVSQSAKEIKGKVASLNAIVLNQDGYVSKDKAIDLFKKGQPLVLKADGGSLYFVYYADGFYAGKELSRHADKQSITVKGRVSTKSGINIIIYDEIN